MDDKKIIKQESKAVRSRVLSLFMVFVMVLTCVVFGTRSIVALEQRLPGTSSSWPGGLYNSVGDSDNVTTTNYTAVNITAAEYPEKSEMQFTNLSYTNSVDYIQVLQWGSLLKVIEVPGADGSDISAFDLTLRLKRESDSIDITLEKQNYWMPVNVEITASDGRTCEIFIIAVPENRNYTTALTDKDYEKAGKAYVSAYNEASALYWDMKDNHDFPASVGGPHPASRRSLLALSFGMISFLAPANSGSFPPSSSTTDLEAGALLRKAGYFSPRQAESIFQTVYKYYFDYTKKTVEASYILGLDVANSEASMQSDNSFLLRLPSGLNFEKVIDSLFFHTSNPSSVVTTQGAWRLGGITSVSISTKDPATWHVYNNDTDGIITQNYLVKIVQGDPVFGIRGFSASGRSATIEDESSTISLHLPDSAEEYVNVVMDFLGTSIRFLDSAKNELPYDDLGRVELLKAKYLVVVNDYKYFAVDASNAPVYTREYALNVTKGNSSECRMLSYSIGAAGESVSWDDNNIVVTVPYTTEFSTLKASIEVSYDASVEVIGTEDFSVSAEAPIKYRVKAQNGTNYTDYYVKVIRTPASSEKIIKSFKYGSVAGTINHDAGTVELRLPAGSKKVFAPDIELSEFAILEPASGLQQDFSNPVTYIVTAQDGSSRVYTVNVTVDTVASESPRKEELQNLLNAIINNYRISADDDWEWMNLGLYEGIAENNNNGFDLAKQVKDLNVGLDATTTDIDRLIILLTARGFDCTNLAKYNGGQPLTDLAGNKIDDLVSNLYNTNKTLSGPFVVNGIIFALIAFDSGNYIIPENAKVTRESLLENLLKHEYLSDGWGIDMVGMLMYAIAPYQNDPVYGARVQAKLDEGIDLIASKMKYDYSFESWDSINSEAASQVISALSSCGVDCDSDPRFSDGTNSVLSVWLSKFAVSGGFKHIESGQKDVIATYEACYALQFYLGMLDRGGAGNPYSLYFHRFDYSKSFSAEANILEFDLDGNKGIITESSEGGKNTISVTVPEGLPLISLSPKLGLSSGASLLAPSLPANFAAGVEQPFTVLAEDGVTTKTYYVTIERGDVKPSGASMDSASIKLEDANLRQLEIISKKVEETASGTEILINVGSGVDVKNLRLYADISYGASASPAVDGSAPMDLSDWTSFTVTSGNGENSAVYSIKVQAKGVASIEGFSLTISGKTYMGNIDHNAGTIKVSGVDDSVLTSTVFAPDIMLGSGTTVCSPLFGIEQDFSAPVVYTVAGTGLDSRSYTVSVTNLSGKLISVSGGSSGEGTGPVVKTDPEAFGRLWDALAEDNTITDHQVSYGPRRLK